MVDLILREIERSDNESLRLKKDLIKDFIIEKFDNLSDQEDIIESFAQYEKEQMKKDMELFAQRNGLDGSVIMDLFSSYIFSGYVSDEKIRQELSAYKLSFLKIAKLVNEIHDFIIDMGKKYIAEGE